MAGSEQGNRSSYRQIAAATGLSTISVKRIAERPHPRRPNGLGAIARAAIEYDRAQSFADRIRAKAQVRAAAYEALEAGVDRTQVADAVGVPIDALDEFIEGAGLP
jgi:hypothetical protein